MYMIIPYKQDDLPPNGLLVGMVNFGSHVDVGNQAILLQDWGFQLRLLELGFQLRTTDHTTEIPDPIYVIVLF